MHQRKAVHVQSGRQTSLRPELDIEKEELTSVVLWRAKKRRGASESKR